MRFMSMIKGPEGAPPTPELMAAVGGMAQELMQKGVLVEMGGLLPSSKGTRMRLANGTLTVTDGPFTESKELVGGYAVFNVQSRAEVIELCRRFMGLHADFLGPGHVLELELRQMEE